MSNQPQEARPEPSAEPRPDASPAGRVTDRATTEQLGQRRIVGRANVRIDPALERTLPDRISRDDAARLTNVSLATIDRWRVRRLVRTHKIAGAQWVSLEKAEILDIARAYIRGLPLPVLADCETA